jgi:outer membrane protein TolC
MSPCKAVPSIKLLRSLILLCGILYSLTVPGPSALPVMAEEKPLTLALPDALTAAFTGNPTLKAARAQVEEALYSARAAGSLSNPTVNLNYVGGNNTISTYNGWYQDVNLNFQQSLGPLGSVALQGRAGKQAWQIAQLTYEEAKISLAQSVKDGYYMLLSAQEQCLQAEENLRLSNELYKLVHTKCDAGAAPRSDLLNAEIQKATMEQALIQSEGAKVQAQCTLNLLLGRKASEPVEVTGELGLPEVKSDYSQLLKMAEENRPLLKTARKAIELSRTQVELAKAEGHPVTSLSYSYDLSTSPLYSVGVTIQAPLFDYGGIRNQVQAQKKTVIEKEHTAAATELSISSALKSSYAAFQAACKNALTYREKVLIPSEKLLKIMEFGYSKGALPFNQVVTAQLNLKTARAQYTSLLLAGHQAFNALEAAVGIPLDGEKQ